MTSEVFIELSIDSLSQGNGVGRIDGRVCFVRGALPGERVRAKVRQQKKNFLHADLDKVLHASPYREEAPCAYFGECGGCQYQHVAYAEELRWKETQVRDTVERIGKVRPEVYESIVSAANPYGYRNGITLHQGAHGKKRAWGFYAEDNTSIIAIDRCLIADDRLNAYVATKTIPGNIATVSLRVAASGEVVNDTKNSFLTVRVLDHEFYVSSRGFFQTNIPLAEKLIVRMREWLSTYRDFELYDLYAGTGLFSVLCGVHAKSVYAVESRKSNIRALRKNFNALDKRGFRIVPGLAEMHAGEMLGRSPEGKRAVILDPPREGLHKKLSTALAQQKSVDALIYVSCDPASLARDLNILLSRRLYRLVSITPFDMFPRTKHIEVVAYLVGADSLPAPTA